MVWCGVVDSHLRCHEFRVHTDLENLEDSWNFVLDLEFLHAKSIFAEASGESIWVLKIWSNHLAAGAPSWTLLGELTALFFTTYFLQQVLCRVIQSTDILIAFNYVWWLTQTKCVWYSFANYDRQHLENSKIGPENSWKLFTQKSRNPGICNFLP